MHRVRKQPVSFVAQKELNLIHVYGIPLYSDDYVLNPL